MTFRVRASGRERGVWRAHVAGAFNLKNILAVMAPADHLKIPEEKVRTALESFLGVKRRQQVRGEAGGVLVIDDFAHHPTAVRVTLEALRATRPERRLIAVFEPRSNTSRRRIFQDQYANSFGAAEVVVLCEVFAKGGAALPDKLDVPRLVTQIQQQNKTAFYAEDYAAVRELLARTMRPGDQVVFLSNGGFGDLPRNTLAYLQESGGA